MEMTVTTHKGEDQVVNFSEEPNCEACGEDETVSSDGLTSVSNFEASDDDHLSEELYIYGDDGDSESAEFSTEAGRTSREFQLASVRGVPEIKVI